MKLVLGVSDIPYVERPKVQRIGMPRKGQRPRAARGLSTVTTGDVAEWLEQRYSVMQAFADLYEPEIAAALTDAVEGSIESIQQGAPASHNVLGSALGTIEEDFRQMLDRRVLDGIVPGVPTKAAEQGVNHRLRRPNARSNGSRPSFIDTGLYQANFHAWIED